jgi:putative membrane protein
MTLKRTMIFAALFAAGIATATAQSPAPGTTTTKPAPAAGSGASPAPATPAPPSAGSTGMDKGAGTGAASSTTKAAASSLARADRRFAEKAMHGGMAEVEAGKVAMDKAQDAQVKAFAKKMVDDHTKANGELMKIASAKGITPPAAVDAAHKRKMDRMASRTGADFDRAYMDEMVDDHQATVRDFRSAAKSAKDPDIKAFAASTLPALEQHLAEAKTLEAAVKGRKTTAAPKSASTTTTAPPTKSTPATPAPKS